MAGQRDGRRLRRAAVPLVAAGVIAALAAPARAAVEAAIPVSGCCPVQTIGAAGKVFVLTNDFGGAERSHLIQIDPGTNTVLIDRALGPGSPSGHAGDTTAMIYAAGSIWVTDYFHDEVLRFDAGTLDLTEGISVGRSPGSVATDGTSVWVALEHDSAISRINPATNTVTKTVHVGRRGTGADGPWQLAYDGTQLLATLPGSGRVARINPRNFVVHYDNVGTDAALCAQILPVPGGYWLDDTECEFNYYRWDAATKRITATVDPEPTHDYGAAVVGNALYAAEYQCDDTTDVCSDGTLAKYDATTGAFLASEPVGPDPANLPHYADGSLWVGDWNFNGGDGSIQRVDLF